MLRRRATIVRCVSCAAPLGDVGQLAVVVCRYCRAENHVAATPEAMAATARRVQVAADEAREMAAASEARGQALMAEYEALSTRVLQGERNLATAALQCLEGYLRLQYAPTLHLYAAMDPDDPAVIAALEQIDATVAEVVASMAESFDSD